MKIITMAIGVVGGFILVVSLVQWFFLFPDPSQLFLGTIAASIIVFSAWVYEKLTFLFQKIVNVEYKLDSLVYPKK